MINHERHRRGPHVFVPDLRVHPSGSARRLLHPTLPSRLQGFSAVRANHLRVAALLAITAVGVTSLVVFKGPARALAGASSVLGTARPLWLLLASAAFLAALVCSAGAWRSALRACGAEIGPVDACARYGVGSLVNSLLPARAGDATRIALFAQTLPGEGRLLSSAGIAATIAALHGLVFCIPLAIAVALGALPLVPVLAAAGAAAAAATTVAALARRFGGSRRLRQFLVAAYTLARSPGRSLRLLGWVAAAAAARVAAAAAIAAAVGVHAPVTSALISIPAVALATLFPVTPANVGLTSAAVAVALHSRGVGVSEAVACGVAFHAIETLAGITFGAAGALRLKHGRLPARRSWKPVAVALAGGVALVGAFVASNLA